MSFGKKGPQTPEARAREAQTRLIEESVEKVKKHFGSMCNEMGSVCRKSGRLRDRYDQLAKNCMEYANVEMGSLKQSLTCFAENVSAVQDYRQAQIERLEKKVVEPLRTYDTEVKHTQADLNVSFNARKRELKQHAQVENLRNRSPGDRATLSQAEIELQKRSIDVARTTKSLEETIDKFETRKVQDIKKLLSEFVKIEMLFHAKALEVYTMAYNDLQNIDEEEHIELFRSALRPSTNLHERLDLARTTTTPHARDVTSDASDAHHHAVSGSGGGGGDARFHEYSSVRRRSYENEDSEDDYDSEDESRDYEDDEDESGDQDSPRGRDKRW